MTPDDDVYYRALRGRDSRFDGVFFVGVTTTFIYCRPVCPAKTPGRNRCQFFSSAALAERAGYRPCLRCRPELAPGLAPIDNPRSIAHAAVRRIEAGALDDGGSLEQLATELGVSSRQLRRAMRNELGVTPIEFAQTNRLLLAKRLVAETQLPMIQVALAAGFESVRRFNALFRRHYRLTPSELRRSARIPISSDYVRLVIAYRPPLHWAAMMRFLALRAIPGVECVAGNCYQRTVRVGENQGWLAVAPVPNRNLLEVRLATSLTPALSTILVRLRNLFDLDARPDMIDEHLAHDLNLGPMIERHPGLRVPGAFDVFELGMRAILGQQISVRGASTLAGRIAQKYGEPIETPSPCLNRLTPTADKLIAADKRAIAAHGLPSARAASLQCLAGYVANSEIDLQPGSEPCSAVERLVKLPGIGPWTAQYIAMRALRWPDAFPAGDLGLIKAARVKSAKVLAQVAEQWRPWRAYAAMHLWESLNKDSVEPTSTSQE